MNSEITLELLQATNPVPQPERLVENLGIADDALLLLINERSVAMSTNTEYEATKGIPDLSNEPDAGTPARGTSRGAWRFALGAFVIVLIAGVAAFWLSQSEPSEPAASASFSLVGGEVTKNFDDDLGWTFADENLNTMTAPGPSLEVEVGTEVTLTFTNRGGWSGLEDEAIPHSFRIVPGVPSPDTLWGADTGLVDPEASATITFTPTEVGDYRYVSDGLGAAGRGMFGRFVVIEKQEPEPGS